MPRTPSFFECRWIPGSAPCCVGSHARGADDTFFMLRRQLAFSTGTQLHEAWLRHASVRHPLAALWRKKPPCTSAESGRSVRPRPTSSAHGQATPAPPTVLKERIVCHCPLSRVINARRSLALRIYP